MFFFKKRKKVQTQQQPSEPAPESLCVTTVLTSEQTSILDIANLQGIGQREQQQEWDRHVGHHIAIKEAWAAPGARRPDDITSGCPFGSGSPWRQHSRALHRPECGRSAPAG